MRKLAEADVVVWLDEVRYTTPGWQDRVELPDGTWLTVPVEREGHRALLREVTVSRDGWQAEHVAALRNVYGADAEPLCRALDVGWAGESLVTLNVTLNDELLRLADFEPTRVRQSDYHLGGRSISERLVRTVRALGGSVYLSGPGGWNYLDADVFAREGIALRYHSHTGPNPCALGPVLAGEPLLEAVV